VTDVSISTRYLLCLKATAICAQTLEQYQNIVMTKAETGHGKYRLGELFIGMMFIPVVSVT
jgi:hypothetical protein